MLGGDFCQKKRSVQYLDTYYTVKNLYITKEHAKENKNCDHWNCHPASLCNIKGERSVLHIQYKCLPVATKQLASLIRGLKKQLSSCSVKRAFIHPDKISLWKYITGKRSFIVVQHCYYISFLKKNCPFLYSVHPVLRKYGFSDVVNSFMSPVMLSSVLFIGTLVQSFD